MKKNYHSLLILSAAIFTNAFCFAQNKVVVSTTDYTNPELVNNVLLNSSCLGISNISYSTGPLSINGIGYFEKGESTFPFESGIILATGYVKNASEALGTFQSSGSDQWAGDTDIQNLLLQNIGLTAPTYNATRIEFDFVPLIDYINIDFIFASNEYGTFQCNYGDAFAFFLTDVAAGTTTNLAVVPGTEIPISVTTIRNSANNPSCPSVNPDYFAEYNQIDANASINYNGRTVPLSAQGTVIPGHLYHIKLAITDYGDSIYDSAVFLNAGGFNIGDASTIALASSNGPVLCEGAETILGLNFAAPFTYTWYYNNEVVAGANQETLTVSDPGTYTLTAGLPGTACSLEYSINIVSGDETNGAPSLIQFPEYVAYEENTDGITVFDLNSISAYYTGIIGNAGFSLSYYPSAQDAFAATNPLSATYTNVVNPQTVYVRIENTGNGCFTTGMFNLVVTEALGLNENVFANLQYYPNPVKNILKLYNTGAITAVAIYNTLGQQVLQNKANSNEVSTDLSALTNGVYFVKIQSGDGQKTIRIIKE